MRLTQNPTAKAVSSGVSSILVNFLDVCRIRCRAASLLRRLPTELFAVTVSSSIMFVSDAIMVNVNAGYGGRRATLSHGEHTNENVRLYTSSVSDPSPSAMPLQPSLAD